MSIFAVVPSQVVSILASKALKSNLIKTIAVSNSYMLHNTMNHTIVSKHVGAHD